MHAFNVSGRRRLIDTGEVVGPGGYVYEPAGNIDSWMAIGDEPLVVNIVATGAMEYLGGDDRVLRRDDAASLRRVYLDYCREHEVTPLAHGHGVRP